MYNTYLAPSPFVAQGYAQVTQKPKNTNPLTKEQAAELRQTGGGLSLVPTREESLRAICTHRDLNTGESRLVSNDDGSVTCTICGSTFSTLEVTQDQVKEATNVVLDILQNTKALYLDIPEDVCAQYFKIIPLVEKIPQLYKVASDNFKQYEGINPLSNEGSNNLFARYNMMTGPVMPQYNYQPMQYQPMYGQQLVQPQFAQQQPMMNYAPQQPYYNQQMMQMTAEAPIQGTNPFYGQPQAAPQTQPTTVTPQFTNINNAATATAPVAPATAPAAAPTKENVEVVSQFAV